MEKKENYDVLKGIIIVRHHTLTWWVTCDVLHVYSLWISWRGVRQSQHRQHNLTFMGGACLLYADGCDVKFSMNGYLSKTDSSLDTHAPIKKGTKKELKLLTKPWITQGLQNSVKKKNNIYSKFVWSVKTYWKNFITAVTKTIEIFYVHSSKGLKKTPEI